MFKHLPERLTPTIETHFSRRPDMSTISKHIAKIDSAAAVEGIISFAAVEQIIDRITPQRIVVFTARD